ncbi:AAA family ATPase [Deinococcus yavapaiensis]|uniref:AAA ATPase-like protein n=1 Tax=Deinococcus yavapaiensis KR-236 TaxID=694435 RepID=A0A318SRP4_9DEIO|nr:AAA family ATPase [Deinococcus yavapaiensis]PYE55747.1 AAA ATPase-like protein [Deinococcus yavapaiensis KR-236]
MLRIHLMGHVHVTFNGQLVPLSAKAVALITYVALEKMPQHRERLADLLWNTVEARKNLRVELARIRSAGLHIFPPSRQLLSLDHVTTDFQDWQAKQHGDLNQEELSVWLAALRGLPLSGLEDLGSPMFQEWVEQQRWMFSEQIENVLQLMYWRHQRAQQAWATRAIVSRAEALGFEHPGNSPEVWHDAAPKASPISNAHAPATAFDGEPSSLRESEGARELVARVAHTNASASVVVPEPALGAAPLSIEDLRFDRPLERRALQSVLRRAAHKPQLLMLSGEAGCGKSDLANEFAQELDAFTVQVSGERSCRLALATLAQALRNEVPSAASSLADVLLHPSSLEDDMIKVAVALSSVARATLIVVDHAHLASRDLAPMLEFLLEAPASHPKVMLLLSRKAVHQTPLSRAMLHVDDFAHVEVTPLAQEVVQPVLEAHFPFTSSEAAHAVTARLLHTSEGNPAQLRELIAHSPDLVGADYTLTSPSAIDKYTSEIDRLPAELTEALGRLSVIYGRFGEQLADAALDHPGADGTRHVLREALERHILMEAEAEAPLRVPSFDVATAPSDAPPLYLFRNEAMRVALARQLPHLVRQDVRTRLVHALAATEPGLASYYAQRAGLQEDAERLRLAHAAQVRGARSVAHKPASFAVVTSVPHVSAPPRVLVDGAAPVTRQGYVLRLHEGWLSIRSDKRFGAPYTLRLLVDLPHTQAGEAVPAEVRLVWRLDVFNGGAALGPSRAPFALRVRAHDADTAYAWTPEHSSDYMEDGVWHRAEGGVVFGHWMEHVVRLTPEERAAGRLELSVRAVDVSLTIGALAWGPHDLLSAHSGMKGSGSAVPEADVELIPVRFFETNADALN